MTKTKKILTFFYLKEETLNKLLFPSNFKVVASFAFENCNRLRKVENPTNFNLEIIDENASVSSGIKIFKNKLAYAL